MNNKESSPSPWLYASLGTQLVVTVLLGIYVGYRVDMWLDTRPWFLLVGAFLGMALGLYSFLKIAMKSK